MPVVQDGPPPGGFPAVRYARRLPSAGPGGIALFAAGAAVMAFGFYQVGQGNRERRAVKQEAAAARAALVPFLQAEEDRRWSAAAARFAERRRDVLAKSRDFDPDEPVYKTRWMPPAQAVGAWAR
jgi:NADH dehydrogenase (ubiquinone) 1 alpha subcomplex subunit 13